MNPDIQEALEQEFPEIFGTCHIECGDGWESILRALAYAITQHVKWTGCPPVQVVQVKEKYGTLHFYTDSYNDFIEGAVAMAESLSRITCEECGQPGGQIHKGGWIFTRCDDHA